MDQTDTARSASRTVSKPPMPPVGKIADRGKTIAALDTAVNVKAIKSHEHQPPIWSEQTSTSFEGKFSMIPKVPKSDEPIDDEFHAAISALHGAAVFFQSFMIEVASKDLDLTAEILERMQSTPEQAEFCEQVVKAWSTWLGRD